MAFIEEFADLALGKIAADSVALQDLNSKGFDLKDPKMKQSAMFALTELACHAQGLKKRAGDAKTAGDSAALYAARSLEYFDTRFFEFETKKLTFREFIPMNHSAEPGTETIGYSMERMVGKSEPSVDGSTNMIHADVVEEEFKLDVHEDAVKFEVTTGDIRRAALTGRPIEPRKAKAAHKAAETKMHQHFLVNGLIGSPYIPSDGVVAGASASKLWINKTPKEIVVGDIGTLLETVRAQTFNNHRVNLIGLPVEQHNLISLEWISDPHPQPILQWILEQLKAYGVEQIVPISELNNTGTGGSDHMIGMEATDSEVMEGYIPMELKWMPGQIDGKVINFVGEFEYSDLAIRRPQAFRKAHDI